MNDRPASSLAPARIRELDRLLARDPDAIAARFERAGLLREQGPFEEAKRDYLELMRRKPADFGALNDFGTLVLKAGYRSAARSLFGEAVRHHPDNPKGHVNLANLLLLIGEHGAGARPFRGRVAARSRSYPCPSRHGQSAGRARRRCGRAPASRQGFQESLSDHVAVSRRRAAGAGSAAGVGGRRQYADGFVSRRHVFPDHRAGRPNITIRKVPLPPHDLVFNSIGDADMCAEGLEAARTIAGANGSAGDQSSRCRAENRTRCERRTAARRAAMSSCRAWRALPRRALAGRRRRRRRRRERIFFSGSGARAGLPHRPPFRPRRNPPELGRGGGGIARRRGVADRAARRAGRRRGCSANSAS